MEENYIQFVANYGDWKAVKKLKVESATEAKTIMRFLASLSIGIDRKVEENLRKILKLEKVDEALTEIAKGKKAENAAEVIASASSGKVNKAINEITSSLDLQAKEKKELQEFCKVYVLKKAFKECGLNVDYSTIQLNIPGMRKKLAKKVQE